MESSVSPDTDKWHKSASQVGQFLSRLIHEKPLGTVSAAILLVFILIAMLSPYITPYEYDETDLFARLKPPSQKHWFGTDNLGRDTFSRVLYGARISIYVGLGSIILGIFIATVIGLLSGYFMGSFDSIVQRFVDALMCFPWLLIALIIMAILGPGLMNVILTLAILLGIRSSRVVRGAVISIKQTEFFEAARAIGCKHYRLMWQYVLLNIMAPIIVLASVNLGYVILVEASLSFLGFGVPPPYPSWGGMLSGTGLWHMYRSPWLAIWPGLALSLAVFSANMFGDAMRDLLDPRLK